MNRNTNPSLATDLRAAIDEAAQGKGLTLSPLQITRWAETGEWPWITKRLASRGQIYVSYAAAKRYQAQRGHADLEEARRELTTLLLDAKVVDEEQGGKSEWRVQSRIAGRRLDISATVVRDGRLLVVVACHTRGG